jgi:hypothetical protein
MVPVNVRFYVDPLTNEPHIYRHQVSEEEVEDVLARPGEDRPGREDTRVVLGQTRAGRHLKVIYVPDPEPQSVFVITAYELTGKPLAAYRRRQRRKGS